MLIRRSALEFFASEPDLDRIPPLVRRPTRKQEVSVRPPLSLPGVALYLVVSPSKKAAFHHLVSKLLIESLSALEAEWFSTLLNLEFLRGHSDEDLFTMLKLLSNFSSRSVPAEGRLWLSKQLKRHNLLSFSPSLSIARNEVTVGCFRRWYETPKVILPQRKRGYDDQGNLAPPDSLNWREIALSSAVSPLESEADEISEMVTRIRTAWGLRTDETPLEEVNPRPEVETLISETYRRFRK